jgi:hypothetical protein
MVVKGCSCIEVRFRNHETKELLSDSSIVATLLHECAHAITDLVLRRGVVEELGKKKSRKFRQQHHGPHFYDSYKRILQFAEKHNIFALQDVPDKFSARNLARFDDMDIANQTVQEQNRTKRNCVFLKKQQGEIGRVLLDDRCAAKTCSECRIVLKWENVSKTLVVGKLDEISKREFTKMVKNKLNVKGNVELYEGEERLKDLSCLSKGAVEIKVKKVK